MDEEYDFVVVGSGGGSMCAGLVLRAAGKSVLIVEKTDLVGGSTAKAGGVMWIPNNRFLAPAGIVDSMDQAATYMKAVVGDAEDCPGTGEERQRAYLQAAPRMIDFLVSQGIKLRRGPDWPDYYDERPGGIARGRTVVADLFNVNELGAWRDRLRPNQIKIAAPFAELFKLTLYKRSWQGRAAMVKTALRIAWARLTGKHWVVGGAALQGRMLQAALREGVDIRTDTPVAEILVEDGAAVGVLTTCDGRPWRIGARMGVLVNAGGFAQNQEMRDRHLPHTRAEWSHAAPGDTGDMHRELARLGAAMAQMDVMIGNQMTCPPGIGPVAAQQQVAKPHAFLVDQSGVRYMNECGSYVAFCDGMIARHRITPAIPSWMIFDSRYISDYMLGSSMPGGHKPQAWFDEGYLHRADSIASLAEDLGIVPSVLEQTVSRFNAAARSGTDPEFGRGAREYDRFLGDFTHRPSKTLGTVESAPFFAVPIVPGDVGTFGGAVTDEHARVLREDGTPIARLYATGTTTASVMGRAYPGAGSSIGPSFTWGYVAAHHALQRARN